MTEALVAADTAARLTAMTALDRTLLVEAGAGSGKTSVLAGRVAALLAAGRHPREIAAITFTELAAGELRQRVAEFVTELGDGQVRPDLKAAFGRGLGPEQREVLRSARDSLDELLCTTIHGFCQRLLRPYPVESGMDPGASVMDRADADALLADVLEDWLRARLSGPGLSDDLLVALFARDAARAGALVRDLLRWMTHHRGAPVPEIARQAHALDDLRTAIRQFRAFIDAAVCREPETVAICDALDALIQTAPHAEASEADLLVHVLTMTVPEDCATKSGSWASYRKKGKWTAAARGSKSVQTAERLNQEATACHAAVQSAFEAAQSYAAGRVLQRLAGDLRDVLTRFGDAKRDAALIDFDDLMVKARDLLANNDTVREALGNRFAAVLVDEFQDTDRLQAEILWRLCAPSPDQAAPWTEWALRPGSLFLVGDPKQAIYRFRGADVASYVAVRDRLLAADVDARVIISQNFRSLGPILDWVNLRFETPLSAERQPGFTKLFTTFQAPEGHTAVATLPVTVPEPGGNALRDAEAEAIAEFCARIIGALPVRSKGGERPCRPDDIALLAPTGTELWRYERALEMAGIAVSTQAGKGFFRRQEIQDLIAMTRALADARDTLALGALLRGPLVGLTEDALLDATASLPPMADGTPGRLRLWTPLADVHNKLLRETLAILQGLAQSASRTTPFVVLCQAVEELQVRPQLRRRQDRAAERTLANIDQYLEMARSYDTRGLQAFAQAMTAQWKDAQRSMEGRPDTEQQSVSLVTMHASKGLEWPVVVPINTGGQVMAKVRAALDGEGRLHLPIFGLHGPGAEDALQAETGEIERERHRIWYVAATRARDLLLLPEFSSGTPKNSWQERFGLQHAGLETFDAGVLGTSSLDRTADPANGQDRATFETEAALIAARTHVVKRLTPHLAEAGEALDPQRLPFTAQVDDAAATTTPPRGSLARGLMLHKLIEEVLTGETPEDGTALEARATELALELNDAPGAGTLDRAEIANTVLATLALEPIRAVRDRLVPECPIVSSIVMGQAEQVTLGIADAVVRDADGRFSLVVDWKSDVAPSPETVESYHAQVAAYLSAISAPRGIIVFMTDKRIDQIEATVP